MILRQLREDRGLTVKAAARRIGRTPSGLSKLETGQRGIYQAGLEHILNIYGVTDRRLRQRLIDLSISVRKTGWWQSYDDALPPGEIDYISLEAAATTIRSFQLHLVPGLLQAHEYTRELNVSVASFSAAPREDLLEVRMKRQQLLTQDTPPTYQVILSEAVLRQQVGGPDVMRAQLGLLIEAGSAPHVRLQILPFSAGAHPGHHGSFTVLEVAPGDLPVVLVESLTTGWYLEQDTDIESYRSVFDQLSRQALSQRDSQRLIGRIISES